MKRAAALAALLAALLATAPAAAAQPRTSLADIEDEVMCPVCGTLLELSASPSAERQRAFVERLIAQGKTKEEIKQALVAEYGEAVLALPRQSGFNRSAYLVPLLGLLVASGLLALALARWRRRDRGGEEPPPGPPPSAEQAERLAADLAKYDL